MNKLINELEFYSHVIADGASRSLGRSNFDLAVVNEWFIVDDVIDANRGREGFVLMFGNPFSAVGVSKGEFATRREAVTSAKLHHSAKQIYRVYLERRHGEHQVFQIR